MALVFVLVLLCLFICALSGQTEVVAVGSNAGALYAEGSSSGSGPWIAANPGSLFSEAFGVAFGLDGTGAGLWVAVGRVTTSIAHSFDGQNWIGQSRVVLTSGGFGVAYSAQQRRWVAVGSGSDVIVYSSDGQTWSPALGPHGLGGIARGVAFSPWQNMWVAVGNGGQFAYSIDGKTWNAASNSAFTNTARCVTPGRDRWLAGSSDSSPNDELAVSYDNGMSWIAFKSNIIDAVTGIAFDAIRNIWVMVGRPAGAGTDSIVFSNNGLNWTPSIGFQFGGAGGGNAIFSTFHNRFFAIGSQVVASSPDGMTGWTNVGTLALTSTSGIAAIPLSCGSWQNL